MFLHKKKQTQISCTITALLVSENRKLELYIYSDSVNEKLPPLKFRYFEKQKNYLKTCSFIHDSGQQQIDSEILNSSTSPGTMVHMQRVQFVIFGEKKNIFSQIALSSHASNTRSENATKLDLILASTAGIEGLTFR